MRINNAYFLALFIKASISRLEHAPFRRALFRHEIDGGTLARG